MTSNILADNNYITFKDNNDDVLENSKLITPRSLLTVESLSSLPTSGPITYQNIWSSSFKSDRQSLSSASVATSQDSLAFDILNDPFDPIPYSSVKQSFSIPVNNSSNSNYSFTSFQSGPSNCSFQYVPNQESFSPSPAQLEYSTPSSSYTKPHKSDQGEKCHPQINYRFTNFMGGQFTVPKNSKFFVIKSLNILDINASLVHSIWASTDLGNKRLNLAYNELKPEGKIFLFFSVNGSGKFSGVCEMKSNVDFASTSDIWVEKSRWKGIFPVEWLIIKDVPNKYFHHLKIASNEFKPVTNSRDTQEIPYDIGISMLKIISSFKIME